MQQPYSINFKQFFLSITSDLFHFEEKAHFIWKSFTAHSVGQSLPQSNASAEMGSEGSFMATHSRENPHYSPNKALLL